MRSREVPLQSRSSRTRTHGASLTLQSDSNCRHVCPERLNDQNIESKDHNKSSEFRLSLLVRIPVVWFGFSSGSELWVCLDPSPALQENAEASLTEETQNMLKSADTFTPEL